MKKLLILLILYNSLFSSDAITLDSLFKNQNGLRSITTFRSMSSDNSNSFNIYPIPSIDNEGRLWKDVKVLSLQQTFLYELIDNLDSLLSFNTSRKRREYFDLLNNAFKHDNSTDIDSIWIGGTYGFMTTEFFKPYLTFQTSIMKKSKYLDKSSNSIFKSFFIKASLRNYSDPIISNIYISYNKNLNEKIDYNKINIGNIISLGFDLSIVLSSKVSLDMGIAQSYQSQSKINHQEASNSYIISNLDLGATYSFSTKKSLSISGYIGGTSKSPDSALTISIWQKL